MKNAVIIGSGLGGLATALRLVTSGCHVTILEKNKTAGGRLNQIFLDGFTFDMGPSFMSMSYELEELFRSCRVPNPIQLRELDPLYQVFFDDRPQPFKIWKDLSRLEQEFKDIEPRLQAKVEKYLAQGKEIFDDTENQIVKSNFYTAGDYLVKLAKGNKRLLPFLFRNMWQEVEKNFSSPEARIIFSLIAFFIGASPF